MSCDSEDSLENPLIIWNNDKVVCKECNDEFDELDRN